MLVWSFQVSDAFAARTRAYVQRRLNEGKMKKDMLLCLKRAIAREVYKTLTRPEKVIDTTAAEAQQLTDERTVVISTCPRSRWH